MFLNGSDVFELLADQQSNLIRFTGVSSLYD